MRKLLLAFAVVVMSFAVLPGVNARAVTEDYPSRFLPIVEVKINVGNTQFEDEAFLNAIIADLKIRGLGASKIDVGYAGSIETDFSVTDPENWVMFDHFGWWDEIGGVTDGQEYDAAVRLRSQQLAIGRKRVRSLCGGDGKALRQRLGVGRRHVHA